MKRWLGVILSAVLLFGFLIGCNDESEETPAQSEDINTAIETTDVTEITESEEATQMEDDGLETVWLCTSFSEAEGDEIGEHITFEYDENGRLETVNEWMDEEVMASTRFEYNEDGYITKEVYSDYYSGETPVTDEWEYTYSTTYPDLETPYLHINVYHDGKNTEFRSYEIDEISATGRQTTVWYYSDDYPMLEGRYDYTYDENGNLSKIVSYGYHSGGEDYTTFLYYENGNMVEEVIQYSDNTQKKTTFQYDEMGNMVERTRYYSDGDQSITLYAYDANGNMIKETRMDGEVEDYHTDYEYDQYGNLIAEIYCNSDGTEDYRIIYEYKSVRLTPEQAVIVRAINQEIMEDMI